MADLDLQPFKDYDNQLDIQPFEDTTSPQPEYPKEKSLSEKFYDIFASGPKGFGGVPERKEPGPNFWESINQPTLPNIPQEAAGKREQFFRNMRLPEGLIKLDEQASRVPRWVYSRIAQPFSSPVGLATLPLAEAKMGREALAIGGTWLGARGLAESVPKAWNDPSFENIADVGLHGLMTASVPIGFRHGLFQDAPKAGVPNKEFGINPAVARQGPTYQPELPLDTDPYLPGMDPSDTSSGRGPFATQFQEPEIIDPRPPQQAYLPGMQINRGKTRVSTPNEPMDPALRPYIPNESSQPFFDFEPQQQGFDFGGPEQGISGSSPVQGSFDFTPPKPSPPAGTPEIKLNIQSGTTLEKPKPAGAHPVVEPGPGDVVVSQEDMSVPLEQAAATLEKGGFKLAGMTSDGLKYVFKKFAKGTSGEFDWDALKEGLRRLFGREPTQQEVERAAFEQQKEGPQEGETTGRVAPFMQRPQTITQGEPPDRPMPSDGLTEFRNDLLNQVNIRAREKQLVFEAKVADLNRKFPGIPLEKIESIISVEERIQRHAERVARNPDNPNTWYASELARLQELLPRLYQEAAGMVRGGQPREIGPIDQNIPLQRGQQELPLGPRGESFMGEPFDPWYNPTDLGPSPTIEQFQQPSLRGTGGVSRFKMGEPFDPRYQDPRLGRRQQSGGEIPSSAEARKRGYEDLTPGEYKRYQVFTEDGELIHETYDRAEAHRMADENDGYVQDRGPNPSTAKDEGVPPTQDPDAIIRDYLRREDATPPESADIQMPPEEPNLGKKFIDDESGELNVENLLKIFRRTFEKNHPGEEPPLDRELSFLRLYGLDHEHPALQSRVFGPEDGPAVQQNLPHPLNEAPQFNRPVDTQIPYRYKPMTNQESRVNRARSVVEKLEEAKNLEQLGDIEGSRAARERSRELASAYDPERRVTQADKLTARADLAEQAGNTEAATNYRRKADRLYLEEAGQLKLQVYEKMRRLREEAGISTETAKDIEASLTPERMLGEMGNEWAKAKLSEIPQQGNPGLSIEEQIPPSRTYRNVVYRSPSGEPIALAEVATPKYGDRKPYVATLAANRENGLFGRAVREIGKKLLEMDAARGGGAYSSDTANLANKLKELIKDDTGAVPVSNVLSAYGQGWEKIKKATGIGQGNRPKQRGPNDPPSLAGELWRAPGIFEAAGDFSPVGRQMLPTFLDKESWKALPAAFRAMNERQSQVIDTQIRSARINQRNYNPRTNSWEASPLERAGIKLQDMGSIPSQVGKSTANMWLENGNFLGPEKMWGVTNPFRWTYSNTLGKFYLRPTNRFFNTLINHYKVNRTQNLFDAANAMSVKALQSYDPALGYGKVRTGIAPWRQKFTAQEGADLNPYTNLRAAREIGDFVNTAVGQAPHRTVGLNLEGASKALANTMFSPGLFFSRVRMLNPLTYLMATPFVRKQYLKAAVASVAGWATFMSMAKAAATAQGIDHEIVTDPTNPDFGKFKMGDTRLDFGGSFLQFAVLLGRLGAGGWTSSSNPDVFHKFGKEINAETAISTFAKFMANKLNPSAKGVYDFASSSENKPFAVGDRFLQAFPQLFLQDLYETYKKNPDLLPMVGPAALFGGGTQTYSRYGDPVEENEGKFIPPDKDWVIKGGGPADWWDAFPEIQ